MWIVGSTGVNLVTQVREDLLEQRLNSGHLTTGYPGADPEDTLAAGDVIQEHGIFGSKNGEGICDSVDARS